MDPREMDPRRVDILLIDDNLVDAKIITYALKRGTAFHVLHMTDGEQALHYLSGTGPYAGRDTERKPTLILLDLNMPRLNGLQVLERLKAGERTKCIPVVMLTSSQEDPNINKAYDLGASSYVVKPGNFEEFQGKIVKLQQYWFRGEQSA